MCKCKIGKTGTRQRRASKVKKRKRKAEEDVSRIDATRRGTSKSVEEAGRRVKAEQVQVKEYYKRMTRRKTKGQFCG